jgi:hypothetical protein
MLLAPSVPKCGFDDDGHLTIIHVCTKCHGHACTRGTLTSHNCKNNVLLRPAPTTTCGVLVDAKSLSMFESVRGSANKITEVVLALTIYIIVAYTACRLMRAILLLLAVFENFNSANTFARRILVSLQMKTLTHLPC